MRFVPLSTVARQVRRRVHAASKEKTTQRVTSSVLDVGAEEPYWPFFPNPYFRGPPAGSYGSLEPSLVRFMDEVDEGLDPLHFASRAAGLGPLVDRVRIGFFHGRVQLLKTLARLGSISSRAMSH